jgi:hypothetical protein
MKAIKPLKKIKGVKGVKAKDRVKRTPPPDTGPTVDLSPVSLRETWRYLGGDAADWKLAQRVEQLQAMFPTGTRPELVVYDWLERQQIPFVYQHWIAGGRARRGGAVPDFLINYGGRGVCWLIQGNYWHMRHEVAESDIADKLLLLGQWWQGVKIEVVVEVWESKLRNRATRQRTMELGLNGVEVGR